MQNKNENLIRKIKVQVGNKGYIVPVRGKTPNFIYKNYIEIFNNNFVVPEYPGMLNGKFFNPPKVEKNYIKENEQYHNYYVLKYYDKNAKSEKFLKAISISDNLKFKLEKDGIIPVLVDEKGNIIKEFADKKIITSVRENSVGKTVKQYSEFNNEIKNEQVINLSSVTIQEAETGIEKTYNFQYEQANRNTVILTNGEVANIKNINKKLDGTIEIELIDGKKVNIEQLQGKKEKQNYEVKSEILAKWETNHKGITETLDLPNGDKIIKFGDGLIVKSKPNGGFDIVKNFEVLPLQNGQKAFIITTPTRFMKLKSINGKNDLETMKKLKKSMFKDLNSKTKKQEVNQEQQKQTQQQENEVSYEPDYTEIPF